MVNKQEFLDTYNYFEKSILVEIIDIFVNEYNGRIEKIYNDVMERDYNALRFDAHGLKGVIANFCAPVAWEQARGLEKKGTELQNNNGEGFNEAELLNQITILKESVGLMAEELTALRAELDS